MMKIYEMNPSVRPREKAEILGLASLSDRELLALFIRTGTAQKSSLELADEVLNQCGSIRKLHELSHSNLLDIKGIKSAKAIEILALCEISKRIVEPNLDDRIVLDNPQSLMNWLNLEIGYDVQEHFMVVFLNNQNTYLGSEKIFKGTLNQSLVHPRDIMRLAIQRNATRLILVHNHPGQTMYASDADKEITKLLVSIGAMMDIVILDHYIVSHGRYISMREKNADIFKCEIKE